MELVTGILVENPLLCLFLVAAVGYPLGKVRLAGFSLGVAAVLFAGLAVGALDPAIKIPPIVYELGLVIFVYTIGLSSGPGLAESFRREGLRDNVFTIVILAGAFALSMGIAWGLSMKPTHSAGMFTGSLTNTPAMAASLDSIRRYVPPDVVETVITEPVVAYSIAYPMGVIGVMLAIIIAQKTFAIDYAAEARLVKGFTAASDPIVTRTIVVERPDAASGTIGEMCLARGWRMIFSRVKRGGYVSVCGVDTRLEQGDMVTVVGPEADLDAAEALIGRAVETHLELEKSDLQMRRLFVSNQETVGKKLKDLDIHHRYGAVVTRVRRGDMDMVVSGRTVLEPGDRVRVVAPRGRMAEVSAFFGDSYRAVSEVDVLTFSLGLTLGLILGIVPIPVSGDLTVRLGFAGGPLIVGLALGAASRTGVFVWHVPYAANMTLRQVGLVLFLAGVGVKAGYAFVTTLVQGGGYVIFLAGAAITFSTAMAGLAVGYKLFGMNFCVLTGMIAGIHTQPAILGFSQEQAKNDLPNLGYSAVYPAATIIKILMAQAILAPYLASF